jgi:copper(I)-binding protein
LKEPAPALRIVAPGPEIAMTSVKVGSLSIETPWLRATPPGAKVAAGYLRVVNDGAEPDRLVGASIAGAGTATVHAMTMNDGVMRMRALPDGVAIAPGQSVALEPSGLHLMFENLTRAFKPGERVEGNLVFAKAGTVPVVFAVGDIGGKHAPDAEDHMH